MLALELLSVLIVLIGIAICAVYCRKLLKDTEKNPELTFEPKTFIWLCIGVAIMLIGYTMGVITLQWRC